MKLATWCLWTYWWKNSMWGGRTQKRWGCLRHNLQIFIFHSNFTLKTSNRNWQPLGWMERRVGDFFSRIISLVTKPKEHMWRRKKVIGKTARHSPPAKRGGIFPLPSSLPSQTFHILEVKKKKRKMKFILVTNCPIDLTFAKKILFSTLSHWANVYSFSNYLSFHFLANLTKIKKSMLWYTALGK